MADQKVTQLTEETSPATSDLLYLVDDPGGTPASRKSTVVNVVSAGIPDVGARVYHSVDQSIGDNSFVELAFNSERWDTDSFHDTVTNNSRLTIPSGQGGKYLITGQVSWAYHATGTRLISIYLNGATLISVIADEANASSTNYQTQQVVTTIYDLSATDYVELGVKQWSGGALNVEVLANYSPEFMLQKLA